MRRFIVFMVAVAVGLPPLISTETLSKSQSVSFYQKAVPRDLEGLAIRSDGRIIAGPVLRELAGNPVAPLWWDWESGNTPASGWIGSGPDGQILRVELDTAGGVFEVTDQIETPASHVFVVKRLPDGRLLAGGNPEGHLVLINGEGEVEQSARLPADSVFDILVAADGETAWVATGNPALLFRVDIGAFTQAPAEANLSDRGIERWGAVRDRNLRTLAFDQAGRVLAGSAPSGNLYRFDLEGSPPIILLDHESGEITDILLTPEGDVLATLVDAKGTARRRVMQSSQVQPAQPEQETEKQEPAKAPSIMEAPPVEKFSGRSELIKLPGGDGLPETLSARNNLAMYRIVPFAQGYLLPGGDDGELAGYDPVARRALTFAASDSAQLNDMAPLAGAGRFLLMSNNPANLSIIDFETPGPRRVQTSAIDLQTSSHIGSLRFNRLREIDPDSMKVELRANRGRDAVEGWSPWVEAVHQDGGWHAEGLTGRMVQVAISLPDAISESVELDQAKLYFLPQNRRPVLRSFRLISPNFALRERASGNATATSLTLGQVIGSTPKTNSNPADQRRQALLSSPLVPETGAQVVTWTTSDPDGDNLTATFSVRHEKSEAWKDLLVDSESDWFQFDRRTLAEGVYFTRLVLNESAPRAESDRRSVTFSTDDLVIDLSPPTLEAEFTELPGGNFVFRVDAVDSLSLIAGVRLVFNNGYELTLVHPADGILDSRRETFLAEVSGRDVGTATEVEVYVEDAAANVASTRLQLK